MDGPETELNISPLYEAALIEVVLYQVLASDTDDNNWQKGMSCLETFARILGIKLDADRVAPYRTQRSEASG